MRRAAFAAALALALAACDGEAPPRPAAAPPAAAPAPRAAEAPALPASGTLKLTRSVDRYTLLANEVPAFEALEALGEAAGFAAERGAAMPEAAPVVLRLADVSVEVAIAAILAGIPHHVHFERAGDAAGDPVVLSRVTVGALPGEEMEGTAAERRWGPPPETRARGSKRGKAGLEEDDERAGPAEARERERADLVARQWNDPRADLRLDAVAQMEPEGEDRARLETLLREDPSPEVRSAAAEALSEGDAFQVMEGLLGALGDADAGVVAAAVRGLEDVYAEAPNPRIRERVLALREHRDPAVREAVADFAEWIEE